MLVAGRISLRPLSTLESSHNLKTGARKVLERYYSLHTVGMFSGSHTEMLHETLSTLVNENLNVAKGRGYLVYAKTQTHNTFFDDCINCWHFLSLICGGLRISI